MQQQDLTRETKAIEIHGNKTEKVISVELKDILNCITDGNSCTWSILWLEAVGHRGGISILDLEKSIKSSKNGLVLEWAELLELSDKFYQVIEIILVGDNEYSNLKRYDTDEEMYSNCCYTIELLDSSYWIIHSKNLKTIECLKKNLEGVKEA